MSNRPVNIVAFTILTLLWLAFGAALLFNRELLDAAWQIYRSWPLVGQIILGLLLLPVVLGLWIWETAWPLWLRLILVVGLAWVTLYLFFPWRQRSQAEAPSIKS